MEKLERGGGRPEVEPTTKDNSKQKEDKQHGKLVDRLRKLVEKQEKVFGEFLTREEIIRMKLNFEEDSTNKKRQAFFAPLRRAWDVLAYDRYEPGSTEEHQAGELLSRYYQYYDEPTIRLSDPLQVKVIDALAEVVGIPHERGQTEIAIPGKLKDYDTWTESQEYKERVGEAQAVRRQKGEERYARLCSEPGKPRK